MTDAVRFSGRMLSFSIVTMMSSDLNQVRQTLEKLLSREREQIPVVLDSAVPQELAKLLTVVRDAGLQPIAVVDGLLTEQAALFKLAVFPKSMKLKSVRSQSAESEPAQTDSLEADAPSASIAAATLSVHPSSQDGSAQDGSTQDSSAQDSSTQDSLDTGGASKTKVYDDVLRSGQSVSNLEGDLVMVNGVNNGSEVIATGSLHIYGKAQGRLVAGATGAEDAMIFCEHLDPTLVSIAGIFCLPDSIPKALIGKAVYIKHEKDTGLVFTAMNPTLQ